MGNCLSNATDRQHQRKMQAQAYNTNNVYLSKRCKVNNCKERHNQHYCKVCKNKDSTHFTRNCPNSVNTNNYAPNKSPVKQKCKVNNCKQNHINHFCGVCHDSDSSHFSTVCPDLNSNTTNSSPKSINAAKIIQNKYNNQDSSIFSRQNPNLTKSSKKQRCKVNTCPQEHSKHFCSVCKNQDSQHWTQNCPNKDVNVLTKRNSFSQNKCKVKGCPDDHRQHFCAVCQDKDSSHYASSCPNGVIVYHGTAQKFKQVIKKEGFKPSQTGCIGKGVYFTDDPDIAWQIAKNRAQKINSQPVVFKARIPKDSVITEKRQHPIWDGVTQEPFNELKVNKQKQIKIIKTLEDAN